MDNLENAIGIISIETIKSTLESRSQSKMTRYRFLNISKAKLEEFPSK